jgi:hypothetical protein
MSGDTNSRNPLPSGLMSFPLDQLQDERAKIFGFLNTVNRADVRMIQSGERTRFAFKARQAFRIGHEDAGQDLDGDVAPELRVAWPVDLTHSTAPKSVWI